MSRRRQADLSDDPTSLKGMRSAAIRCITACQALITYARLTHERWFEAQQEGGLAALANGLAAAIELGSRIRRESRLTLGPLVTFGDVTARNAHVAALELAEKAATKIRLSNFAYGFVGAEELRNWLASLPDYPFDVWLEAIESEAHRAPRVAAPTSELQQKSKVKKGPVKRDRLMEARDKWVYGECCKGTQHKTIALKLPKKNPKWPRITTKQGILDCAKRYARRNGLPAPPPRQER